MASRKLTQGKTIVNPQYEAVRGVWQKMRDVFMGQEWMKKRSLVQNESYLDGKDQLTPIRTFDQYLRPTDSMRRLGAMGLQRFCDYIFRAKFYPFPEEVEKQSKGLIENEPPVIELPSKMEAMNENATINKESLEKLLSIVNSEQLRVSRIGLLLIPSNDVNKPFNIAAYKAESILDWYEELDENNEKKLVWVKIKTEEVIENNKNVYLILDINPMGVYYQYKTTNEKVEYGDSYFTDEDRIEDSYVEPLSFEKTLDSIPFVIINVTSLGGIVEKPFLESVADASIDLFKASAHHEDALYWGGESTLMTKGYGLAQGAGEANQVFVGNGAINKTNVEYADAKYVTMGVDGIQPRKENLDEKLEYCMNLSVNLINKGTESGTALNIRTNIKTASLKTLSKTSALGLQTLLQIGALWSGSDPEEVKIKANTVFAEDVYTSDDFLKFASLVDTGKMLESDYFNLQKKNNLTSAANIDDWKKDLKIVKSEDSKNKNPEET